jgi:hypothetical protein
LEDWITVSLIIEGLGNNWREDNYLNRKGANWTASREPPLRRQEGRIDPAEEGKKDSSGNSS